MHTIRVAPKTRRGKRCGRPRLMRWLLLFALATVGGWTAYETLASESPAGKQAQAGTIPLQTDPLTYVFLRPH